MLAARILDGVIERYTRPEMGAVWSEQAQARGLAPGRARRGRRARRAGRRARRGRRARSATARRSRSRRSRSARRSPTTTWPRSSTWWPASVGEAGRWVHHGLTSSDVLDTALGAPARAGGADPRGRRAPTTATRWSGARASTRTRSASAARTACTPSPRPSASSSPASPSRRTATCAGSSARSRQASVGALSGAVGTYAANGPEFEEAVLRAARASRARTSRPRSCRATATPSCWRRSRWPAPASSASPPRSATSSAPRCARSRSRSAPGQKGSSAMPHKRNPIVMRADHRHRAAAARLRPGRARERRALARARHLALVGRARGAARRDDPARLRAAPRAAGGRGDDRARRPDAREPRRHPRRALLAARAARAGGGRAARATTPTGSSRRRRSAPGTRARRSATCSPQAAPEPRPRRDLRPRRLRAPRGRDRRPARRALLGRTEACRSSLGFLGVLAFSFTLPATREAVEELDPTFVGIGREVVAAVPAALILLATRAAAGRRASSWRGWASSRSGVTLGWPAPHRARAAGPDLGAQRGDRRAAAGGHAPWRRSCARASIPRAGSGSASTAGLVAVLAFAASRGRACCSGGDVMILAGVALRGDRLRGGRRARRASWAAGA